MGKYGPKDLEEAFESFTARVTATCEFTKEVVGGQPADRAGVEAFVKHHLKIGTDEVGAVTDRIMREEVGERDTTPDGGEVKELESYGVRVIRKDEKGPWIGDWMVKACMKAAASRLGLFQAKGKIGSKGDLAEMGRIRAIGNSLNGDPERIHLFDADGKPAGTTFQKYHGRVSTPQGARSIVHDSETAPAGSRFAFELRFPPKRLSEKDVVMIFAAMRNIGLGSAKALERGKFEVLDLEIVGAEKAAAKKDGEAE